MAYETNCGVNSMMVVCGYSVTLQCFYPSGPCEVGMVKRAAVAECAEDLLCEGTTQYATQFARKSRLN